MQTVLLVLIVLHILAGVFWAGSTFTMAHLGGAGAARLFRPQLGAATVAILSGIGLWGIAHGGPPSTIEWVLGIGALAALAALAVQVALRGDAMRSQRIAAGLLMLTVVCMAASRYIG